MIRSDFCSQGCAEAVANFVASNLMIIGIVVVVLIATQVRVKWWVYRHLLKSPTILCDCVKIGEETRTIFFKIKHSIQLWISKSAYIETSQGIERLKNANLWYFQKVFTNRIILKSPRIVYSQCLDSFRCIEFIWNVQIYFFPDPGPYIRMLSMRKDVMT